MQEQKYNRVVRVTDTYYNGGVDDKALQKWYVDFFKPFWDQTDIESEHQSNSFDTVEENEVHLCVDCNICCNGTLFSRVPVSEKEMLSLGGGSDFFVVNGQYRMKLGCSRLGTDGCCQVYDHRPKVCRTYRCDLLKRLENKELDKADAIEIVKYAKTLQQVSIDSFARAMKEPFDATDFQSAVDARNYYADQRNVGWEVNKHLRKNAWFNYEMFIKYIQTNFRSDFDPD